MKVNQRYRPGILPQFCIVLAALILAVNIPTGQAVKPGEVYLSAEIAAGLRAVANMDSDEKIRNPDYLAKKFLTPDFWFLGFLSKDYQKSKSFIKFYRLNYYYTVNPNTWHIDTVLQKLATQNLKQVVNIGAGFDSRPYRFGKLMPDVRFFEVDQLATQNLKKKMVKAEFGELPANVAYIPIEYRTNAIFDALKLAGYDKNLKTLFIWEGSAVYTDSKVADQTMRDIANHSGTGSEIVFDYFPEGFVKGDYDKYPRAWYIAVRTDASGEPLKFGIAEGQAGEFITQRGFKVISDLGSAELAPKYLTRSDGDIDGKPAANIRVMRAVVER